MLRIPKHAVYEGILHQISGGERIEGTGGGTTGSVVVMGPIATVRVRDRDPRDALGQRGWVRREFVDVGDTRIRNLTLTPYYDALLGEALGQEVALSVAGGDPNKPNRHTVQAIRTPRGGVNRDSSVKILAGSIFLVVRYWFGGVILAFLAWGAAIIVGGIFDPLYYVGAAFAVALLFYCLVIPFVAAKRALAANAALG